MGACCSNKNQKSRNISKQQQPPPKSQDKYHILERGQAENQREQDLQKVQEAAKPETQNKQNDGQNFDEDLFVNDIMKQFDDLNILFNQMSSEFDQISQYLLSMSGNPEQQ
ncbi:unnamed protein product [Paramecium pentaurelia]|uniref:Uncharacterized protein n=1 Tax=Paramecium pentaurelia TaxID=43138 RepID=A0A8S1SC48_9CILI|nr:unnamed protein product [Paramecium pentaurelia]